MKLLLSFLGLMFINIPMFGQKRKIPNAPLAMTPRLEKIDDENKECIHKSKYNLAQRLALYTFNKAIQVKIVSFDNKPDSNGLIESNGYLPMQSDTVDYSQLDEIKILTNQRIDTLTDILYNTGYKNRPMIISASCYNPRNAILFVDSSGKTFAFIELCFQCGGYRTSSNEVETGEFCNEKYEMLKKYFERLGIEIGISKGVGLL